MEFPIFVICLDEHEIVLVTDWNALLGDIIKKKSPQSIERELNYKYIYLL